MPSPAELADRTPHATDRSSFHSSTQGPRTQLTPLAQAGLVQGLVGEGLPPAQSLCLGSCERDSGQQGARRAHCPERLHLAPSEPRETGAFTSSPREAQRWPGPYPGLAHIEL